MRLKEQYCSGLGRELGLHFYEMHFLETIRV